MPLHSSNVGSTASHQQADLTAASDNNTGAGVEVPDIVSFDSSAAAQPPASTPQPSTRNSTASKSGGRAEARAKLDAIRQAKSAIQLTDAAAARLKELLACQNDAAGIRVGVRKRGCSGNTYVMDYASEKGKFDEEVSAKGVRLFINPQALLKVTGTVLDFQEDELGSQFVFDNPNAKGSCGCGESFYV